MVQAKAGDRSLCFARTDEEDNGGWGSGELPEGLFDLCDFPRVDESMTTSDFERRFMRGNESTPCVIVNGASRLFHWTKEYIETRYGDSSMATSYKPQGNHPKKACTRPHSSDWLLIACICR